MKVSDIITLINAGYTKSDIEALEDDMQLSAKSTPEQKPVVDNAPEPEKKPEPQTDPVMSELKALKDQISKMSITTNAAEIPNEEDKLKAALAKLIGG